MDNLSPLGPPSERSHGANQIANGNSGTSGVCIGSGTGSSARRPQTLMAPIDGRKLTSAPQIPTLTIHKDANGYGMKVSGDNPVYVESVKAGGAAQKAGLVEGDMILEVNGTNVRKSTHTNVVQLIKASATVDLTVQRNYNKMQQRPSSVSSVGPSTPLAQRGGITAPVPVDSATSHELKMRKIETLRKFLDKERKNLENLKSNNRNDNRHEDIAKTQSRIKTMHEQLYKLCGEVNLSQMHINPLQHQQIPLLPLQLPSSTTITTPIPSPQITNPMSQFHTPVIFPTHHQQTTVITGGISGCGGLGNSNGGGGGSGSTPTVTPSTPTPPFLSRFPRSLSSLSLGTKKKINVEKENSVIPPSPLTSPNTSSVSSGSGGGSGGVGTGNTGGYGIIPLGSGTFHEALSPIVQHHHQQSPHHIHHHHNQNLHHHQLQQQHGQSPVLPQAPSTGTPTKKKFNYSGINSAGGSSNDIPPPLPKRNVPRKDATDSGGGSGDGSGGEDFIVHLRRNIQISDLDQSTSSIGGGGGGGGGGSGNNSSNNNSPMKVTNNKQSGGKQRSKQQKIKALSDPKVSSQMFIDMEQQSLLGASVGAINATIDNGQIGGDGSGDKIPPPLPPRLPGMLEEKQNIINNNKTSQPTSSTSPQQQTSTSSSTNYNNRPPPNSLETLMSYPLTTTTQAVRDNFSAFPLSHRPNVQQILQQQQQLQQQLLNNHNQYLQQQQQQQQLQLQQQQQQMQNSTASTTNISTTTTTVFSKSTASQLNKFNNAQHRRAVSSPAHYSLLETSSENQQIAGGSDNRHVKSTSGGSWGETSFEKESTDNLPPPLDGTPPPRYSPTPTTNETLGVAGGLHHQMNIHQQQSQQSQHNQQMDDSMNESIFDIPFHHSPSAASASAPAPAAASTTMTGSVVTSLCGGQAPNSIAGRQPQPLPMTASGGGGSIAQQRQIISMEDDEIGEDPDSINEDHGPFRSLHQLLESENIAYLAVFLNFVLSNSNPSPLLFYLITGLYKDGTVKDMRKWAYEIHSTFLVPRAPLLWCAVNESETLARDVDNILQKEYQKGEILRVIFQKSRKRAKDYINQQMDEFKLKRTAGLGTMYGPGDHQLCDAKGDKVKEQKIFEETLMPKLQQLVDELDKETPNECPKNSALSSALSTVLHRIFITRSNPGSPIDKVHHFVSREKSFKSRLMGKNRKAMVRGHHLVLRQYYEVAHCNHCQSIIWGVSPQGYHCTDCELNIHRACSKVLEENCPGPAPSKQKPAHTENKMSKLIEKIRPTQYFVHQERQRRLDEEGVTDDLSSPIGKYNIG